MKKNNRQKHDTLIMTYRIAFDVNLERASYGKDDVSCTGYPMNCLLRDGLSDETGYPM